MSVVESLYSLIQQSFKSECLDFNHNDDHPSITVKLDSLVRVCTILRDHPQTKLTQLVDITTVDTPSDDKRFRTIYQLLSHNKNFRLYVQVYTSEKDFVPSLTSVFPNAGWYEREVWDLYGVSFKDNNDLRRILTDYNFEGHPMRKDFPVYGYTQVRYDEEKGRVIYEPVNLMQEYRDFNFLSPWEGDWKQLIEKSESSTS